MKLLSWILFLVVCSSSLFTGSQASNVPHFVKRGAPSDLASIVASLKGDSTTNVTSQFADILSDTLNNFVVYKGDPNYLTQSNCHYVKLKDSVPVPTATRIASFLEFLDIQVRTQFDFGFTVFHVCLPSATLSMPLSALQYVPGIDFVEREQFMKINQVESEPPWGLDRIDQSNLPLSGSYSFNLTGKGVNIYTIDSGIDAGHAEFAGRAQIAYTVFTESNTTDNNDCTGHGTHVAGIAAGTNVGVAKLANVLSVRFIGCSGSSDNSLFATALQWVMNNIQKPAILSMSIGGPKSAAIDSIVSSLISTLNVPVIAAAGNDNTDACTVSPANLDVVVTVGATTRTDTRASFSNYGSCVDIFAPGDTILSAGIPALTSNGYYILSGTSMATPFVTGVVALLLEQQPNLTPAQIWSSLSSFAASGVLVDSTLSGTRNLLLQSFATGPTSGNLVTLLPPGSLPSDSGDLGLFANFTTLDWLRLAGIVLGVGLVLFGGVYGYKRFKNRKAAGSKSGGLSFSASIKRLHRSFSQKFGGNKKLPVPEQPSTTIAQAAIAPMSSVPPVQQLAPITPITPFSMTMPSVPPPVMLQLPGSRMDAPLSARSRESLMYDQELAMAMAASMGAAVPTPSLENRPSLSNQPPLEGPLKESFIVPQAPRVVDDNVPLANEAASYHSLLPLFTASAQQAQSAPTLPLLEPTLTSVPMESVPQPREMPLPAVPVMVTPAVIPQQEQPRSFENSSTSAFHELAQFMQSSSMTMPSTSVELTPPPHLNQSNLALTSTAQHLTVTESSDYLGSLRPVSPLGITLPPSLGIPDEGEKESSSLI